MDKIIKRGDFHYIITNGEEIKIGNESSSEDEFNTVCNIDVKNICYDSTISFHILSEIPYHPSYYDIYKKNEYLYLTLGIDIDHIEWAQPFKMKTFYDELLSKSKKLGTNIETKIMDGDGCDYIDFTLILHDGRISDVIDGFMSNVKSFIENVLSDMLHSTSDSMFSKIFSFPESYKFICCQYLMWFGEFLSGLGIEAEISAKDEGGGRVVFTTVLKNNEKLMSEVESLFYEYLCLPYCEYLPLNDKPVSVEEMLIRNTLLAQIEHFKSQVLLKDSIIEAKKITIDILKENVRNLHDDNENKRLLIDSLKELNEINILNGAIKFGDIKKFGITVSPKKLIGLFIKKNEKM
ncbi:hypothetical protein [Raoultella terrigena]|uniref:hypothetical protein n=1 Tax=Raoultella terrigena TaxID=577 RepID=UPI0013301A45|nr:hypothetical protein [Raoultella terrigena]